MVLTYCLTLPSGEEQLFRDLAVRQALRDQAHDLDLPRRQRGENRREGLPGLPGAAPPRQAR